MDASFPPGLDVVSLIKRVRVAREGGQLPATLADDLHIGLCLALPTPARREVQADYLRSAAGLLEGSPWQRAKQLAAIIRHWTGRNTDDPIKAALYRATATGLKLPSSTRQLYRIIAETDS